MRENILLVYRFKRYDNTDENEQFQDLCKRLLDYHKRVGGVFVFVGEINIGGCYIDALLIKENAIIVIEFKNYGGHIIAVQNGQWTADEIEIKGGGNNKSVLEQATINHSAVKKGLGRKQIDKKQIMDVPTLIVFNKPITIENRLDENTKHWLRITDNDHFIEKIDAIVGRKTNLSPQAIVDLADQLGLSDKYLLEDYCAGIKELKGCAESSSNSALVSQSTPIFAEEKAVTPPSAKQDLEKENEKLKREIETALKDKEMSEKSAREKVSEVIKENEELRRENEKKDGELKAKEIENEKKDVELKAKEKENKKLTRENKKKEKAREREQMEIIVESTVKSVVEKLGLLSTESPQSSKSETESPAEQRATEMPPVTPQNENTPRQEEPLLESEPQKPNAVEIGEKPIEEDEETKKQKAFIASILSIYTDQPFNIEIFKNGDGRLNSLFAGKAFYKENVIKVESANISDKVAQIGSFIGKEIHELSSDCIYWEDGEEVATREKGGEGASPSNKSASQSSIRTGDIRFRKSNTSLPDWLDRKIFGELGAIYAPEHQRYEFNLDLNEDELKVYLGTYFPRSYAEMFCIADNLFQNKKYLSLLAKDKEEINILDCGCGTGGEIVGLITALYKHLPQCKINVTSIDGNKGALRIADKLIREFPTKYCPSINIETICQTFTSVDDFAVLKGLRKPYQFVLCNKIACELISKLILPSADAYAILAEILVPQLADNGLLTILDVTTKDEHSGYFYPQLMNLGLNKFVAQDENIETILPLSCSFNEDCIDLCFMQQSFFVSHSHKSRDESRVCYRVICKKSLKDAILNGIQIDGYAHLIHPERYNQDSESAICKRTKDKKIIIDSFNINL